MEEKIDPTITNQKDQMRHSILEAQFRGWLSLSQNSTFRIMSFNILADSNIEQCHFKGKDLTEVYMPKRFHLVIQEIKEVNPDILCCQEVDSAIVEDLRTALGFESDEV